MRTAIIACMKAEDSLISSQKTRFMKFDGDVEQAAEAFEAAETANADQLAAILAGLDRAQAGGGAPLSTPVSTPIGGGSSDASASGASASGGAQSDSGAAQSPAPAQNAPSAI